MDRFFVNVRTALGGLIILAIVYFVAGTAAVVIAALILVQLPLFWLVRRRLPEVDRDAVNVAAQARQFKARPQIEQRLREALEMYVATFAEHDRTIEQVAPGFQRLVDRALQSWK